MDCVVVLNPVSGTGRHAPLVRRLAAAYDCTLSVTGEGEDGADLAADAVQDGADIVLAAGGDGTVNEVVRGVHRVDGFGDVVLGVVPVGTGNNFATNIGVTGVRHAFALLEEGERRWIDLGVSDIDGEMRPFISSCIGGLPAAAIGETTAAMKRRFGSLAYALTALRTVSDEGTRWIRVRVGEDRSWDAVMVLVGNGRRYPNGGGTQADMEDGRFEVTVVEEQPVTEMASEAAVQRLLGGETPHISQVQTEQVKLAALAEEGQTFSLDGEIVVGDRAVLTVVPRTVQMIVGGRYESHPQ